MIREGDNNWQEHGGLLFFHNKLYVPALPHVRAALIQEAHSTPSAGHQGVARTQALLAEHYYWPELKADVRNVVLTCDICQRVKADHRKPGGLLQPLPVPLEPWDQMSMDFIVGLLRQQRASTPSWCLWTSSVGWCIWHQPRIRVLLKKQLTCSFIMCTGTTGWWVPLSRTEIHVLLCTFGRH